MCDAFDVAVTVGVPLWLVYLAWAGANAAALIQVLNYCFLTAKVVLIGALTATGTSMHEWLLASLMVPISLPALLMGSWPRRRVDERAFRLLLRAFLLVLALLLAWRVANTG